MFIFGKRLKEARLEAGLYMWQLARKIGVSKNTILHWELGHNLPKLDGLMLLADELNVSIDWLAGRTDKK